LSKLEPAAISRQVIIGEILEDPEFVIFGETVNDPNVMQCKSTKLLAHRAVRETSLFTGAIPNQVRNSQLLVSFRRQIKIREGQAEDAHTDVVCDQ